VGYLNRIRGRLVSSTTYRKNIRRHCCFRLPLNPCRRCTYFLSPANVATRRAARSLRCLLKDCPKGQLQLVQGSVAVFISTVVTSDASLLLLSFQVAAAPPLTDPCKQLHHWNGQSAVIGTGFGLWSLISCLRYAAITASATADLLQVACCNSSAACSITY
jgi:hypothetical protein